MTYVFESLHNRRDQTIFMTSNDSSIDVKHPASLVRESFPGVNLTQRIPHTS